MTITDIIINETCGSTGVSKEELQSKTRRQLVVSTRMVVAMLMKEFTCMEISEIGRWLGQNRTMAFYYLSQGETRYSNEKGFSIAYDIAKKRVKDALTAEWFGA